MANVATKRLPTFGCVSFWFHCTYNNNSFCSSSLKAKTMMWNDVSMDKMVFWEVMSKNVFLRGQRGHETSTRFLQKWCKRFMATLATHIFFFKNCLIVISSTYHTALTLRTTANQENLMADDKTKKIWIFLIKFLAIMANVATKRLPTFRCVSFWF